ncbi:hypothetical protein BDA99DRAFT_502150 [Phascolomyces articulosus]|uniref:F-box domain-containing protein n=1 Tax=Phascolomyces articulosus TaxID=60185 RepID=A0AAD5KLJ7_9FUNG|nr:hypothetical protein BDA99DRAFT_502150 [Phascolomyces articulosus]
MSKRNVFEVLTYDISTLIFSYLTQQDCLKAMSVCKLWYDCVPQYSKDLWKTLKLEPRQLQIINRRHARCIGGHVKSVIIYGHKSDKNEEYLYTMMQYLLDHECDEIESMEIVGCSTQRQLLIFLTLLRQFGSHLIILALKYHTSNTPLLQILSVLPNISHFIFTINGSFYNPSFFHDEPLSNQQQFEIQGEFTNLQYLRLDCLLDTTERLHPILQKCPNLQYFFGVSRDFIDSISKLPKNRVDNYTIEQLYINSQVNLDQVTQWCPRLKHFIGNCSYGENDIEQLQPLQPQPSDFMSIAEMTVTNHLHDGVCYISLCEDFFDDNQKEINSILQQHQYTLEYLKLNLIVNEGMVSIRGNNWSPVLPSLQLNRLHTFTCHYIDCDIAPLFIMLNNCPVINTVSFRFSINFDQKEIDLLTLDSIHIFPTLRTLNIVGLFFDDDIRIIPLFFERFPALEKLTIVNSSMTSFKEIFHNNRGPLFRHLKHLSMENIVMLESEADQEGDQPVLLPLSFFTYLAIFQQPTQNDIQHMQTITLWNVPGVTCKTLIAIASLLSLERIQVLLSKPLMYNFGINSSNIDDDEDNQLLHQEDQRLFLQFIEKLHKTKIKELRVNDIYCLSSSIFESLGNLRSLKILDLGSTKQYVVGLKPHKFNEIDFSGISMMLHKTTSLRHVRLSQIQNTNDITCTVNTFLSSSTSAKLESWTTEYKVYNHKQDGLHDRNKLRMIDTVVMRRFLQ